MSHPALVAQLSAHVETEALKVIVESMLMLRAVPLSSTFFSVVVVKFLLASSIAVVTVVTFLPFLIVVVVIVVVVMANFPGETSKYINAYENNISIK